MTISQSIVEDMKTAMRAKDSLTLNVVRNLKSSIKYAAIEKLGAEGELPDLDVITVIRKEIKKRHDSIEGFEKGGRPAMADNERAEIEILSVFLPAAPSAEEVAALWLEFQVQLDLISLGEACGIDEVLAEFWKPVFVAGGPGAQWALVCFQCVLGWEADS